MQPKNHVDTTKPTEVTHLSLCTGYGGIDLGLARVVSNLRTIAYCEREAAAIELLLSRMENGQLDAAPIWTDLRSFPWAAFSDCVDILSGGYPCQPFSNAGKRLGAEDERHLWPAIADGVRILRPRVCFFENVEGHITLGLSTVISDLEELGYEVSWGIFSAAEVGAPHQRKRVFIMAYRCGEGLEGDIAGLLVPRGRQKPSRPTASGSRSSGERGMADSNGTGSGEDWKSSELAYSASDRLNGGLLDGETDKQTQGHAASRSSAWPSRPGEPQHWWEPPRVVANTEFIGRRGRGDGDARGLCGEIQIARPCGGSAEPAVGNATNEGQPEWGCREMGQPRAQSQPQRPDSESDEAECETQSPLGGDADGAADWVGYGELCISSDNRTDELRMLGNGVVPATAARAFVTLMEELL